MVYTTFKNDHDGFTSIIPKSTFKDLFESEASLIYDSEYANYNNKLYAKIEGLITNPQKMVLKSAINSNRDIVDNEVIYFSKEDRLLIAIKQYWDLDEYAPSELEDIGIEGEIEREYVKVNKRTPFQAKISFYSFIDNEKQVKTIYAKIISKDKKPRERERTLDIICSSSDGLYLKSFKTKKISLNLEEHYNDSFLPVSDTIIKRLSKKNDNGIILLHSDPGAGKTTYLRYLTNKIKDKRLIYLPPDMAYRLGEPDFMSFLMGFPNSVLFIEDAENCLKARDGGGNQAVSNLLNSSDGLLGDALKIQIVCTFNCDLKQIDSALLRPGRLIAEHRLEKLSLDKTKNMIAKLYPEDQALYDNAISMTLAEIFNLKADKHKSDMGTTSKIGFGK